MQPTIGASWFDSIQGFGRQRLRLIVRPLCGHLLERESLERLRDLSWVRRAAVSGR